MYIKLATALMFLVSLTITIRYLLVLLSKAVELTITGRQRLAISMSILILSSLQLFGWFDFVKYITK